MYDKKLLIVFNCFNKSLFIKKQLDLYFSVLDSIFWHIDKLNLENEVRVVISAVLVPDHILLRIKNRYKDKLTIFTFQERLLVQITFNKICDFSEKYFNEKYYAYQYSSSGSFLPEELDFYPNVLTKLKSGDYGMITTHTFGGEDGYHFLGFNYDFKEKIDFKKDYNIPPGCFMGAFTLFVHSSLKEFYGHPLTDVHGKCGVETGYSFECQALRKKYIVLGNYICKEIPAFDGLSECKVPDMYPLNINRFYTGLMFGRTYENTFLADKEGIDAGLGYYSHKQLDALKKWGQVPLKYVIDPNLEKYDENYLSLDERLKYSVKRNYFTNKSEFDYDKIKVGVL